MEGNEFKINQLNLLTQDLNKIFELAFNPHDPFYSKIIGIQFKNEEIFEPKQKLRQFNKIFKLQAPKKNYSFEKIQNEAVKTRFLNFYIPSKNLYSSNVVSYKTSDNLFHLFSHNFDAGTQRLMNIDLGLFGHLKNLETKVEIEYSKDDSFKSQLVNPQMKKESSFGDSYQETTATRGFKQDFLNSIEYNQNTSEIIEHFYAILEQKSNQNEESSRSGES